MALVLAEARPCQVCLGAVVQGIRLAHLGCLVPVETPVLVGTGLPHLTEESLSLTAVETRLVAARVGPLTLGLVVAAPATPVAAVLAQTWRDCLAIPALPALGEASAAVVVMACLVVPAGPGARPVDPVASCLVGPVAFPAEEAAVFPAGAPVGEPAAFPVESLAVSPAVPGVARREGSMECSAARTLRVGPGSEPELESDPVAWAWECPWEPVPVTVARRKNTNAPSGFPRMRSSGTTIRKPAHR